MIGRLTGLRGQVSSHWLASIVALAYLIASAILGVALLTEPRYAESDAAPAANTPAFALSEESSPPNAQPNRADDSGPGEPASTTTPPTRTTQTVVPPSPPPPPTTTGVPAGFQRVTGPAGLRTVIPAGWPAAPSTGPGAMRATDPTSSGRFVKYGGSLAPPIGIEPSHVRYENLFAARTPDYRRILLSSATYGGHDAVEWEFEHRDGANLTHVRSLYWRADGKEYFVLASAPVDQWPGMKPIYDTMIAHAEP